MNSIIGADAWRAGAGIDAPWMPIREDLIDYTMPQRQVDDLMNNIFGYASHILENPPGTHPPICTCYERYWGLCQHDDGAYVQRAITLTKNVYALLKINDLHQKASLPLLVEIGGPLPHQAEKTWHLIVDTFDEGEVQIMIRLQRLADGSFTPEGDMSGMPVLMTSHILFRGMLQRLHKVLGEIDDLSLSVYDATPDAKARFLQLRMGRLKFESDMSCNVKIATRRPGIPFGLGRTGGAPQNWGFAYYLRAGGG